MEPQNQNQEHELDPQVTAIVKALAYTENGGKPTTPKAGRSGEMKSIFQFLPATWKGYSKEILGREVPMNTENEAVVTYGKVHKWYNDMKKQGVPDQDIPLRIGSIWNSGNPDKYKQNWKGEHVNPDGSKVKYDTPAYAKKVGRYYDEFSKADTTPASSGLLAKAQKNQRVQQISQQPLQRQNAPLPSLLQQNQDGGMKQVRQI